MKDEDKQQLLQGMFQGATLNNVQVIGVAESGSNSHYHAGEASRRKPTAEQLARAIAAINGKNKVLAGQQDWLGVCCLLSSKYDFALRLSDCVEQIHQLPFRENELEVECKLDNIRRFNTSQFVKIDTDKWKNYHPSASEETVFLKSYSVVKALQAEIERQMNA